MNSIAADRESGAVLQDVSAEAAREIEFISGYMGLMYCSEKAARAVYMHRPLAGRIPMGSL